MPKSSCDKNYRLEKVTQKARELLRDYKLKRATSVNVKGDLSNEEYESALFMSVIMSGEGCDKLTSSNALIDKREIKS